RRAESFPDDTPPGLRQLQQAAPSWASRTLLGSYGCSLVRHNHLQLSRADAVMCFRRVVQPSPDNQPQESQRARDHERRPPSPAEVNPQNNEGSDSAPDGGTTVKKGGGQRAFTLREPL